MALTRDFTATTFVVRDNATLLLWHNKIKMWLPPGGHIHDGELPEEAAVREVREETGLGVELVAPGDSGSNWGHVRVLHTPQCILLEDIEPGHQHIDLIYFARARDDAEPKVNPREASRLRWVDADGLESEEIAKDVRILGVRSIDVVGACS
ncbi:MAG: NUDIX domain-containing protein [Candidatus Latescibacterota bacterium]|nr:NUDIX domain-containing protein [Candidatus Latescibacterota bacterium]